MRSRVGFRCCLTLDRVIDVPIVVYVAVAVWGGAFGGAATLFQTALAKATDAAQAVLVTVWNAAIAGGGILGGALLDCLGFSAFFPVLLLLLAATFVVVWKARRHGFPVSTQRSAVDLVRSEP
ncbi:hypothetical protein [Paraburkholderia sp. J67]|uniref:hypothetical protein n=1 Tax=Paraburkholderia sp. J67 TaxID=2805435 RepID=UPI0039F560ED